MPNNINLSEDWELILNQPTRISVPITEHIATDKRMWNSIKRRIAISDNIFDFKDIALIYIWAIVGWWVSLFSVDEKIIIEYRKWLFLLSVWAVIVVLILVWMKKQKKEFNNTIISDMQEIEDCC